MRSAKKKKVAKRKAAKKKPEVKARKVGAKKGKLTGNTAEVPGTDAKRVAAILAKLDEAYPDATCELTHHSPFELLIATILSAQCTDVRVNQVTQTLFKKYPNPEAFAYANPSELENEIRPTGFFRNKTKSIMGASKEIVQKFQGKVPRDMDALLTLPGVARKTANVVLGSAYGIASGVVVDTHVIRLTQRLDLTRNEDPKKIEQEMMQIIPKDRWIKFSHQLIWHGRRVCYARKPNCVECNLNTICYSGDKTV